MERLDPRGRAMLRAYRQAKVSPRDEREALWARIEASLDAGAAGASLEPASAPARASSSAWPVVAVVMAVAAIVIAVLALRRAGDAEQDPRKSPTSAPYDAVPSGPAVVDPAGGSAVAAVPASAAGVQDDAPPPRAGDPTTTSPAERATAAGRRGSPRPGERPSASERDDAASGAAPSDAAPTSDDAPTRGASTTEVDELRAEMALIREARQALRAGRAEGALDVLDAHARAFPQGQMREDREVLRIEALCAAGKAPQARAEARLFLRAFPRSAHAQRVRSSCAEP